MSIESDRRQLQSKRKAWATAAARAANVRGKAAVQQASAAKARASAAKTKSAADAKAKTSTAERAEAAANKYIKDAAAHEARASRFAAEAAKLEAGIAKAESRVERQEREPATTTPTQARAPVMEPEVFVSSRAGAPTAVLFDAIHAANMRPTSIDDTLADEPIGPALRAAIDRADLLLIVWDTAQLQRSVMFEAGYALGTDTRVALLDARPKRGSTDDPSVDALLDVPRLHGHLSDFQGLRRELDAIRHISHGPAAFLPIREEPPNTLYGEAVSNPDQHLSGNGFEQRVLRVLDILKIRVVRERQHALEVADWNAWVPGLEPPFNPVLIELAALRSPLRSKREQLYAALNRHGSHLGILVTLDPIEPQTHFRRDAAIIEASLDWLESAPQDLVLDLRRARNSLVHRMH